MKGETTKVDELGNYQRKEESRSRIVKRTTGVCLSDWENKSQTYFSEIF